MENAQYETTAQHSAYLGTEPIRKLLLKFSVPLRAVHAGQRPV